MMRNKTLPVLLSLAVIATFGAASASAQAEKWTNDPPHSGAYFSVLHNHVNNIRGSFHKMNAVVMYDPKDVSKTSIDVTLDATTIDTDVEPRDKDLRENYFQVDKFPTLTFKSKKVVAMSTGKLKITGDLTIHGVTKEVAFDVTGPTPTWVDDRRPERKVTHMGAEATTTIKRADFGIAQNPLIGDDVMIVMSMDLVKQVPAPAGAGSN
jgi:polyisoprenoid-binding protein YceI